MLKETLGELKGKRALVLGRSNIVGKPMAALLLAEHCTVTIAHSRTEDLAERCREADILVCAVGRAEMVKGDWVKPGAAVIDVGINRVEAPEKGAGVEHDGHGAAGQAQARATTVLKAGGDVLRRNRQAFRNGMAVGEHVGLMLELDQGIGILPGHGERAARPVVLERARQHLDPVGGQRAGDGVAGQAPIGPALEAEADRPVASDGQTRPGRPTGRGGPPPGSPRRPPRSGNSSTPIWPGSPISPATG